MHSVAFVRHLISYKLKTVDGKEQNPLEVIECVLSVKMEQLKMNIIFVWSVLHMMTYEGSTFQIISSTHLLYKMYLSS